MDPLLSPSFPLTGYYLTRWVAVRSQQFRPGAVSVPRPDRHPTQRRAFHPGAAGEISKRGSRKVDG